MNLGARIGVAAWIVSAPGWWTVESHAVVQRVTLVEELGFSS